jgi:hypothetical protein
VIGAVTLAYVGAYRWEGALPAASGVVGHGIGIAGFVLMLMTATLYSWRKLRSNARWGATASWLRFHMVTGLVGPYMVLLHTAMDFQCLAGLAMLLTAVVATSGLVGRYLYTRLPRLGDPDDADEPGQASERLATRRRAFATWHMLHVPIAWALFAAAFLHIVAALYYATLQR